MNSFTVCFIGCNGEMLMEKKLKTFPLKEDFIIEKSIEFFNDPEPCMIHRSAVMKRIYMEIYEFFLQAIKDGKKQVCWDELPSIMKEGVDIPRKVQWIVFK